VRQPKLPHRKAQTPIVAKQITSSEDYSKTQQLVGICVFTKFIKVGSTKKGYSIPEKENTPNSVIKFVSQY
jgi:hypothetical protein